MRLSSGSPSPEFSTSDFLGNTVKLSSFRGRKVLLSFYRYASCPICNLRMRELILAHPRLAAQGLVLVAVFQSPAASIAEYVGKQDAPFPIVADPEMHLYRRFGLEQSWLGMLAPATIGSALRGMAAGFRPGRIEGPLHRTPADFLIDEAGRIALAHYGRDPSDHLELAAIEQWASDAMPDGVVA